MRHDGPDAFVVLDFETTGLSPRRGEVIETGAVRVENGRCVATFEALSRPSSMIPEAATSVHGITDAMVEEYPPFRERLRELLDFLGGDVVVAHHARFDAAFLGEALRRNGLPPLANDVWCTVRLSRRLFPEIGRHDLGSLCLTHGIRRHAAHRALDDARATAELLGLLLERADEQQVPRDELGLWAAPPRPGSKVPPRVWSEAEKAVLEEAITVGDRVELAYVSRRGVRGRRVVVPYVVHGAAGATRLVAYDVGEGRTRTFRLDRVVSLRLAGGSD